MEPTIIFLKDMLANDAVTASIAKKLSSFTCKNNPDVQNFLHNTAIENEKRESTRTVLVVDAANKHEIIGFYSITEKTFEISREVSGTLRSKLTGKKNASTFNSLLIAQLGRSDKYKDKFKGKEILETAVSHCLRIFELLPMRIVYVEYDNIPVLNDFYIGNNFNYLQHNDENNKLMAYMRL